MNFKLIKSSIKGKEELTISISASDSLEREFFDTFFKGEIVFSPIKDEIIITQKAIALPPINDNEKD